MIENSVLTRTRRNMIAVSVVLALINSLGWNIPSTWSVFGAELRADPKIVEVLLWIAFVYLLWEYRVHLLQYKEPLRNIWVMQFKNYHHATMLNRYQSKYDSESSKREKSRTVSGSTWAQFYVWDISVRDGESMRFGREFDVVVTFGAEDRKGPARNIPDDPFRVIYVLVPIVVSKTWLRLLSTNDQYFEFVFPLIFPLAAVIALVFDRYPFW